MRIEYRTARLSIEAADCDGNGVTDSVFSTVKNIATRAGASLIVS